MRNSFTQTTSIKAAVILLLFVSAFAACRKADSTATSLSGTYTGKFYYANNAVTGNQGVQGASFTFTGNNYTASYYTIGANLNSVTTTTTGSYMLKSDSVNFHPDNIVPGILQTSQIFLDGGYEYHFEGDSLIITARYSTASYNQYRLKKN